MALLDDILAWSQKDLKPWQRDALRRLFAAPKGALSTQDMDELYALLKAAHGLSNPSGLAPIPLAPAHLPANSATADVVILKSMHSTKHLNRLVGGQRVEFAPNGLTDIFGDNGTGKSGYGRGLKRACRARDQSEPVHADASDPLAQVRIPEATFDIEAAGVLKSVTWKRGVVPPEELSTIAVFDSHCARVYLTTEQEAAYVPFGLNMVEDLGNKVLPNLTTRLAAEIKAINVDSKPFAHLLGDTKVGKLIAGLSYKTVITDVQQTGTLSQEETASLAELDRILAEADPNATANAVRRQAQRLTEVAERLDKAISWVKDEEISVLRALVDAAAVTAEAERIAAENFRAGETLLPGTGEPIWRALFDSARRYSEEVAYLGHPFPHTESASCVLCQQPLTDGAGRLTRFDAFIKADAAKAAEQARTALNDGIGKITRAILSQKMADSTKRDLEDLEVDLARLVATFEAGIEGLRTAILKAAKSNDWTALPTLPTDPRPKVRDHATRLVAAAAALDSAADATARQKLVKERDELKARQQLSGVLTAVVELVERLKLKNQLEACDADLKTKRITEKSKAFATVGVNQALSAALDDEFQKLSIGHIKTKLIPRGGKGKNTYRLGLDLPTAINLEEILSEGEQRAIAIGSFLAELRQANHRGGIIFDDPVSSLDHMRRLRVAARLAEEAKHRQVIVFTHDTVFLAMLQDAADEVGITHLTQNLECRADLPGYVIPGLPWDHQTYKERMTALKANQGAMVKTWPAHPSAADTKLMREQYSLLRSTIEQAIEEVVFSKVVRRHHEYVQAGLLKKVMGFDTAEHAEYDHLYKRCHKVTSAHNPSSGMHASVPTAVEFGQDLAALEAAVAVTKKRQASIS